MQQSNFSNSSSVSKINQNLQLDKHKVKVSFQREIKKEHFTQRKILMNQNFIDKLRILLEKCQQNTFILLEDPESSKLAKAIQIILLLSILLSCITIIVDSIYESSNIIYNSVNSSIKIYLIIFFGIEYLLRLFSTSGFDRSILQVILSPMNLIDFLSLLSFLSDDSFSYLRILRLIRFIQIMSLFKYSSFIKEISIIVNTVKNSFKEMFMLIIMLFIIVIFFSTIIYYLEYEEDENDQVENHFNSILEAIWWCVVTMTTVGYGDFIPQTIGGKFIACIIALLGAITISLPIAVIGIKFYRILKEKEDTDEMDRLKQNYQISSDVVSNDQFNLRELQFMENRLEQFYQNNEKVIDYLSQSQQLFDELTANLMSLYKALSEEIDFHLEYKINNHKMKQGIMNLQNNIEQKKQIELNQLIHQYKENKRKIAESPIIDELIIESVNSVHARLQSIGNKKKSIRMNQMKLLKNSKEINYEMNSELKIENLQINEIHLPDLMEDTLHGDQQIRKNQLEMNIGNDSEESQCQKNQEDCDIQNKILGLKQQQFIQRFSH